MSEEVASPPPSTSKEEEPPRPQTTSVKDMGVWADQNKGHRRKMEDAHYLGDGFTGDKNMGLWGVFDGHGGRNAAAYTAENLHKVSNTSENEKKDDLKFFCLFLLNY